MLLFRTGDGWCSELETGRRGSPPLVIFYISVFFFRIEVVLLYSKLYSDPARMLRRGNGGTGGNGGPFILGRTILKSQRIAGSAYEGVLEGFGPSFSLKEMAQYAGTSVCSENGGVFYIPLKVSR